MLRYDCQNPTFDCPSMHSEARSQYGFIPSVGLLKSGNLSLGPMKRLIHFSCPSILKPFDDVHLRSTGVGAFLSNLNEGMGEDIMRMNCVQDWGLDAGLLIEVWYKYGNDEHFAKDPLAHLHDTRIKMRKDLQPEKDMFDSLVKAGKDTWEVKSKGLYATAMKHFKRLDTGDEETVALWKSLCESATERFKLTYERFSIKFDEISGISQADGLRMREIEEILGEREITKKENGATIVEFKRFGFPNLGIATLRDRDGRSTTMLRKLAIVVERQHLNKSNSIFTCLGKTMSETPRC